MYLYEFLKEEYKQISLSFSPEVIRDKTFFITGANGLLGSNFINYLYFLNEKHNLNLKIVAHSFSEPVEWLVKADFITYINSDLNNELPDFEFDILLHCATYGQPKKFVENKLGTVKLNTQTYIKLLDSCKKNNAKVLFLSSSEVYGQISIEELPAKEDYNGNVCTLSDRAIYAESKRIAETISKIYKDAGLDIKIVRLGITYGPGVKLGDSRFINEFIKKALNDKEIKMMDNGEAKRHFCFVSDAVEMMLNVLFSGQDFVYNISGEDKKTVFEAAEIIAELTNTSVSLPDFEKTISGTSSAILLDNSRYQTEFKKQKFVSFDTGVKSNIEWLKLQISDCI